MSAFLAEENLEPTFPNSIRLFFRNIVRDSGASTVPRDGELNLLIVAADSGSSSTTDHPREIYEAERERLGDAFILREFMDTILRTGPVPSEELAAVLRSHSGSASQ